MKNRSLKQVSAAELIKAAKNMDWQQVVINGGPPCFHFEGHGRFCGRAQRWHDPTAEKMFHKYVPFEELLSAMA